MRVSWSAYELFSRPLYKPHLVTSCESILVSQWTFQLTLVSNHKPDQNLDGWPRRNDGYPLQKTDDSDVISGGGGGGYDVGSDGGYDNDDGDYSGWVESKHYSSIG